MPIAEIGRRAAASDDVLAVKAGLKIRQQRADAGDCHLTPRPLTVELATTDWSRADRVGRVVCPDRDRPARRRAATSRATPISVA